MTTVLSKQPCGLTRSYARWGSALNNLNTDSDFQLISFNVSPLFTRVLVDDKLVDDKLRKHDLPRPVTTIIELFKLCVVDLKFIFNDEFHSQNFGIQMGNPLSTVLCHRYMDFFFS